MMRARLVEDRIGHSPEGHERRLPAGTVVDITGINPTGHMRAHYHGYGLSVSQDQATPIYDEEVLSMSARDKIQGKIDAITLLRRDMAQMERAKTLVPADPTEGQADYWMVQGLDALRRQWQERIQRLADELNGLTGMATPGAFDELVAGPARMI